MLSDGKHLFVKNLNELPSEGWKKWGTFSAKFLFNPY
jgi:hypothetical protein